MLSLRSSSDARETLEADRKTWQGDYKRCDKSNEHEYQVLMAVKKVLNGQTQHLNEKMRSARAMQERLNKQRAETEARLLQVTSSIYSPTARIGNLSSNGASAEKR